ncbi:MAG: hypothetical protein ACYSUF_03725 [Planctomycetota bacterium]
MPIPTSEPTTAVEKVDRVADLPHRPRVLLGKMGLDGHDRGVKLIARPGHRRPRRGRRLHRLLHDEQLPPGARAHADR